MAVTRTVVALPLGRLTDDGETENVPSLPTRLTSYLPDALPLVRLRARAMQQAVPVGQGAMAAILGLDAAAVVAGCARAAADTGEVVSAANFNDPKQTVVSGSQAGVARACDAIEKVLGDA